MAKQPVIREFSRPVEVLRYIPQDICWKKAEYRALLSRLPVWEKSVLVKNGQVQDGRLLLQENLLPDNQHAADILLLHGTDAAEWVRLAPSHRIPFFLQLHRKEGTIWLELHDFYYSNFGAQSRGSFDLLPLTSGKSAAVHVNSRYWHTMAGKGMDTYYHEYLLYMEHLGAFERAELVEEVAEKVVLQAGKEIDLRDMMY